MGAERKSTNERIIDLQQCNKCDRIERISYARAKASEMQFCTHSRPRTSALMRGRASPAAQAGGGSAARDAVWPSRRAAASGTAE